MVVITPASQDLLKTVFGSQLADSIISATANSDTFNTLLNDFSQGGGKINAVSGTGASTSGSILGGGPSVISIGKVGLPDPSDTGAVQTFADELAHELGHATQRGGVPPSTSSDPFSAMQSGLYAEGVAVQQEYNVAQQLGITMYSGSSVQAAISAAIAAAAPGTDVNATAIAAGAKAYELLTPSTVYNAGGNANYNEYYALEGVMHFASVLRRA